MCPVSPEQQRILDAIREYGYVKRYGDWRTGSVFITTGTGLSFDPRSFNGLLKRRLIVRDPEDPGLSHAGTRFILGDSEVR